MDSNDPHEFTWATALPAAGLRSGILIQSFSGCHTSTPNLPSEAYPWTTKAQSSDRIAACLLRLGLHFVSLRASYNQYQAS